MKDFLFRHPERSEGSSSAIANQYDSGSFTSFRMTRCVEILGKVQIGHSFPHGS
jgi:hypothetical protein